MTNAKKNQQRVNKTTKSFKEETANGSLSKPVSKESEKREETKPTKKTSSDRTK